eukprot:GILI01017674.1.p1 GENE.GILI01017674.1~~GILI01017674.1.p1  ORF type:complete len:456 (+),score=99.75 GILI01017674.1:95-1369(+)
MGADNAHSGSSAPVPRSKPLGFLLLGIVVFLWVGSGVAVQAIFEKAEFKKPFFVTFFSTSLFSFYILPTLFRLLTAPAQSWKLSSHLPKLQMLRTAALFCPLWFLCNYTYNASLALTTVSSNTILSTTCGLFTLVLSILFLREPPSFLKGFAVLCSFMGVVVIALNEPSSGDGSLIGDMIALASAFFYAVYGVGIKVKLGDESTDMNLFFGLLGLVTICCLWPLFFILNALNAEVFEFPSSQTLLFLAANGVFGTVISNFLWAHAVLLLSPLVGTLGLSLSIPIALVTDSFLNGTHFPLLYLLGSGMVLTGFVVVAYSDHKAALASSQPTQSTSPSVSVSGDGDATSSDDASTSPSLSYQSIGKRKHSNILVQEEGVEHSKSAHVPTASSSTSTSTSFLSWFRRRDGYERVELDEVETKQHPIS